MVKFIINLIFGVPVWQIPEGYPWPEENVMAFRSTHPDAVIDLKVKDDTGLAGQRTYHCTAQVEALDSPTAANLIAGMFDGIPGYTCYTLEAHAPEAQLDLVEPVPVKVKEVVFVVPHAQDVAARIWDNYQLKPKGSTIQGLENRGGACKLKLTIPVGSIPETTDPITDNWLVGLVDRVFGVVNDCVILNPESGGDPAGKKTDS